MKVNEPPQRQGITGELIYLSSGDGEFFSALLAVGGSLVTGPLKLPCLLLSFFQILHLQLGSDKRLPSRTE